MSSLLYFSQQLQGIQKFKSFWVLFLTRKQNTRFFYKQHFYKQHPAETGKKLSKS